MAKKKVTTFRVKNPNPVPGESEVTQRDLVKVFRPEHWEFRKAVNYIHTAYPRCESAQWILELMQGTYDEYGTTVRKYIPFVLEFFVDVDRTPMDTVCLWIISNWWHFWGYGPRPDTKAKPKTRLVTTDDSWKNDLTCPVCNRIYDVPKKLVVRADIIEAFTKWLVEHAKTCQEPISKYQQRKLAQEKSATEKQLNAKFLDYTKHSQLLKLQGEEAELALKLSIQHIHRLELENYNVTNDRRDRQEFYDGLEQARNSVREDKIKVALTQPEYWELSRLRTSIADFEGRIENLSAHLNVRGTKTQIKLAQKALNELKKRQEVLMKKANLQS